MLSYVSLNQNEESTTILLADSPQLPNMVNAEVSLDRFPELKVAHTGDWFQVEGRIRSVDQLSIALDLADIRRMQAPPTSLPKAKKK